MKKIILILLALFCHCKNIDYDLTPLKYEKLKIFDSGYDMMTEGANPNDNLIFSKCNTFTYKYWVEKDGKKLLAKYKKLENADFFKQWDFIDYEDRKEEVYLDKFVFFTCQHSTGYTPKNLVKLSKQELITRAKNLEYPNFDQAIYKNSAGKTIPRDSIKRIPNPEDLMYDLYANDKGIVKEVIIRDPTPEDKLFTKKIQQIFNEGPPIQPRDIDCSNVQNILQEVFDNDQGMRNNNIYDPKADHRNLEIVVNLIEQCGMPKYDEIGELPFWGIIVAFQHSNLKNLKKYYPLIKNEIGIMPMVEDRILMWERKPQLYGTQIENGRLYELFEPEKVNKRRAEVGLDPLQDYLKRWNIKFDVPQVE